MNDGKYIFAQIAVFFLPRRVFDRIVKNHKGINRPDLSLFVTKYVDKSLTK